MEIKEIIVSNFCQDYGRLTSNNSLKELICLIDASYDFSNVFDEDPYAFLITTEKDFKSEKVQSLINSFINQFWVGVKLGFMHGICLDEESAKIYTISDNRIIGIRCV